MENSNNSIITHIDPTDPNRMEYRVKGSDGWTLVTHDINVALDAYHGRNKNFGEYRVAYDRYKI